MNQTWENDKKTNFEPGLGQFWPKVGPPKKIFMSLPLLEVIHCCKLSLYAISRKTNEPNLRKWQKYLVLSLMFGPFSPNSAAKFFCSKMWLGQSLDIMGSYHHVQYQRKLMIQSWENLAADGRTDGEPDESDFVGPCPTNVACLINQQY